MVRVSVLGASRCRDTDRLYATRRSLCCFPSAPTSLTSNTVDYLRPTLAILSIHIDSLVLFYSYHYCAQLNLNNAATFRHLVELWTEVQRGSVQVQGGFEPRTKYKFT
ncbi:hypothetical protein L208DRAFT_775418 [Tricholoma matsutake]|nr:hypothetical protein L208DRAFT_775418 [Tricholoma matsutake 945]